MNCKIISSLNYKKIFKDKEYKYIIFDINSLTIVPFINSKKYESNDHINITPFIETFKLFVTYKKYFPNSHFIFVFDGGISPLITDVFPKYKDGRQSRKFRGGQRGKSKAVYDYNVLLLNKLFDLFGETAISDIIRNESDFIIGYLVNKLSDVDNCLVVSHDKDLLLTYNKNNNVDVIYKQIGKKNTKVTYYFIDNFDCLLEIVGFNYLKNTNEYLFYKALLGDTSDKIPKPFGIKSKKIVNNMFEKTFMEDINITYEYIVEYFKIKFKKLNPQVIDNFIKDFRRNLLIMNIFSDNIISDNDKIKLNSYINNIKYGLNSTISINLIYDFFEEYGLYLTKTDLDNTFNYLKGLK
jgi:5'-3' exonuclease